MITNEIRKIIKSDFSIYFKNKKSGKVGYILAGFGIAGMAYLCYKEEKENEYYLNKLTKDEYIKVIEVQKRLKDTLLYFTSGLGITALISSRILNNPYKLYRTSSSLSSMFYAYLSFFCLKRLQNTQSVYYKKNKSIIRNFLFLVFNASIAHSISPFLSYMGKDVMRQALLLTTGCFTGLGIVSRFSNSYSHLKYSGVLGAGLGTISALGFANVFLKSQAVYNYWLYGGLGVFLGYTIYDLKNINFKAMRTSYYDPIMESINLYTDFVTVFLRNAGIIEDQKVKTEEEEKYRV